MTTDPFIEREEAERERATWQESAEAADRERHDWQVRAVKAEDRAGEYHDTITALRTDLATALDRAEQPHTLTADDITDEMVDRAYAWWEGGSLAHRTGMRAMLTAALTEPTRPKGAEDIEAALYSALPSARLDEDEIKDLADALAGHLAGDGE